MLPKCLLILALLVLVAVTGSRAQRNQDSDDDFDDAGFDDNGYSSPQSHDAEGSHHNPNTYSPNNEEDLDDDDDVDESHLLPQIAAGPSRFYEPAASVMVPLSRPRRQADSDIERDIEQPVEPKGLNRHKRHAKHYIGPVYTYVKTDKHAHFKWGVKHKVGKKHHG